jgi:hypothetical protein
MYFCTLSDKKYLLQGLALYNSLAKFSDDFRLCYLCMDDDTYNFLEKSGLENIVAFRLSDLEANDPLLRKAKNNPPSKYGNQYSQYCWALTPYFMDFLLSNDLIPEGKELMYADSDIEFYHSPQLILDAMADSSIGIHSHRYSSPYSPLTNPAGEYNVGVLALRNDLTGRSCVRWWRDCLLEPNHRYYEIYGTCGDQKYLDLFQPLFGSVCVFDTPIPATLPNPPKGRELECDSSPFGGVRGGVVGYLAPWCCDNVQYMSNGNILYKGQEQHIVFCHFSHFNYDLALNTWKDSHHGEWNPTRFEVVKKLYEKYFQTIININQLHMDYV